MTLEQLKAACDAADDACEAAGDTARAADDAAKAAWIVYYDANAAREAAYRKWHNALEAQENSND